VLEDAADGEAFAEDDPRFLGLEVLARQAGRDLRVVAEDGADAGGVERAGLRGVEARCGVGDEGEAGRGCGGRCCRFGRLGGRGAGGERGCAEPSRKLRRLVRIAMIGPFALLPMGCDALSGYPALLSEPAPRIQDTTTASGIEHMTKKVCHLLYSYIK
jgi:hypothetical protein